MIVSFLVGGGILTMGFIRASYYPWSAIIGISVFVVGAVFAAYFWRSADRQV